MVALGAPAWAARTGGGRCSQLRHAREKPTELTATRKRVTKATRKRKEQAATTPVVAGGAPEAPSIVDLDVPSYLRRS